MRETSAAFLPEPAHAARDQVAAPRGPPVSVFGGEPSGFPSRIHLSEAVAVGKNGLRVGKDDHLLNSHSIKKKKI